MINNQPSQSISIKKKVKKGLLIQLKVIAKSGYCEPCGIYYDDEYKHYTTNKQHLNLNKNGYLLILNKTYIPLMRLQVDSFF